MAPVTTGSAELVKPTVAISRVLLLGNPNTGKTTLFNRLCGVRAKTANFPGTTAMLRVGRAQLPSGDPLEVVDLPGVYQVNVESETAGDIRRMLGAGRAQGQADAALVVVEAANLSRSLVLVGELLPLDMPVVVCLNMTDLARRRGVTVDVARLSARLGVPVVPTIASRGIGLTGIGETLARIGRAAPVQPSPSDVPRAGASLDELIAWTDDVVADVVEVDSARADQDRRTDTIDRFLTHPVSGTAVFVAIMGGLFYTLFELASVPMDLIEATFGTLGGVAQQWLPPGPVQDLVTDGVISGIAGTVVFLPQIMLLFFLISLLEDTGYLARAAFVNDRFLRRFGLPGQAFVPLLTSHACAIPGLMSTRLIPDRRDRLATILVLPFMSCSARLPVYVLLTSLLFADRPGLAGLAFAGAFLLGAAAAFGTAAVFGRTMLRGQPRPLVMELPSYKWPSLANAVYTARDQGLQFLKTAGTIIFAISVVMWWLSAYPGSAPPPEVAGLRAQAAQANLPADRVDALLAEADAVEVRARQASSFAGRIGRFVQPVFAPLGYDWQLTDAVLTSFVAREVFVSTMAVLAGAGDASDVDDGILSRIRSLERDDGTPVFTPATSASALVFFVLAMQCLATLTVTRSETGTIKYAALQLGYMSALAYVAALVVYQGLRLAGIG